MWEELDFVRISKGYNIMTYLGAKEIFNFIVNDFESAWDSLAANSKAKGRGNFMFALLDMILLEFASRFCSSDASGQALKKLSQELCNKDEHYFTKLPTVCCRTQDFDLPFIKTKGDELIWAIWDLVRNGQSHQYQHIVVNLNDGKYWGISIGGAEYGQFLDKSLLAPIPSSYLNYRKDKDGNIWLNLFPEILFSHLKESIINSKLLDGNFQFPNLVRPIPPKSKGKVNSPFYQFDSALLEKSLKSNNHIKC